MTRPTRPTAREYPADLRYLLAALIRMAMQQRRAKEVLPLWEVAR